MWRIEQLAGTAGKLGGQRMNREDLTQLILTALAKCSVKQLRIVYNFILGLLG